MNRYNRYSEQMNTITITTLLQYEITTYGGYDANLICFTPFFCKPQQIHWIRTAVCYLRPAAWADHTPKTICITVRW